MTAGVARGEHGGERSVERSGDGGKTAGVLKVEKRAGESASEKQRGQYVFFRTFDVCSSFVRGQGVF